ncbi:MAG TPA: hypothetical protein VKU41_15445, partial [Polyangiaceae bacterium]|nr:hypothetical protein [Polyangiaceae bacterium]
MGAKLNGQVNGGEGALCSEGGPGHRPDVRPIVRPVVSGGDRYGTHRSVDPRGALPQPAWRLDNDFSRLFEGEVLVAVETLNVDAASFAQMEGAARQVDPDVGVGIAHIVLRTVGERGKQHNPATGSGGMLLGRVLQVARADSPLHVGDRVATLASLSLTPLRVDRVRDIRRSSAQIDVDGEAVVFASSPCARLPADLPERVALAALDVAGAAPLVARIARPGGLVVVLGGGGKSGVLCAAEARRRVGPTGRVVGVESSAAAVEEA